MSCFSLYCIPPGWRCLSGVVALWLIASAGYGVTVENNFEGGNARLLAWDRRDNRIVLGSGRKRDDSLAIHLHCAVSQFDSRRELEITISNLVPPRGLYVREASQDWRQIQSVSAGRYRSRFPSGRVEIAIMPPYPHARLVRWMQGLHPAQHVVLGTTPDGNRLSAILVKPADAGRETPLVMLLARQHAFEQAASWVTEGMLDFFLSNEPEARHFRSRTVLAVVPMADVDGVRAGISGKHTGSKDWNRSWQVADLPRPEQRMIRNWLDGLAQQYRPVACIDVHAMGFQMASPRFGLFLFDNTAGDPVRSSRLRELGARFMAYAGYPLGIMPLPGWKRLQGMFSTRMQQRWDGIIESYTVECTPWRRPDGLEWTVPRIKDAGSKIAKAFCGGY